MAEERALVAPARRSPGERTFTGVGPPTGRGYRIAKRTLDIVVSSLALLLLLPLLLLVAAAIKLESRGPIFFTQSRVRGRCIRRHAESTTWVVEPFRFFKFRTMVVSADPDAHRTYMTAYISGDENHFDVLRPDRAPGDSYRPPEDPRVTRVGAVLRKLSLDELPQLWNVVKGDMSLVGPRPPMDYEVELYGPRAYKRLAALGGITGWAQVSGRCMVDFKEQVRLDLAYVARRSIWFDVKILLVTVPVVLSRRGAG
jgi:lipopolysaccharide/colanic/teichoic acid biosynthesis glycosyltransferase